MGKGPCHVDTDNEEKASSNPIAAARLIVARFASPRATKTMDATTFEDKLEEKETIPATKFEESHMFDAAIDFDSSMTATGAVRELGKRRRKDDDDNYYNVMDETSHLSYKPVEF